MVCTTELEGFRLKLSTEHASRVLEHNVRGNGSKAQRFVPSNFGCEEDKITPLPPFEEFLKKRRKIKRATKAASIPFIFVAANCFAAYFVSVLLHPHDLNDEIVVYGDGEADAVLNYKEDVGKYTIKVANDPRARNRVVTYRPVPNIISQHQLISLWEEKTGRSFKRVHVPEEDLVKLSQTLPPPENILVSILHSIFVKEDLMSYEIDVDDLEVSRMYPEMQLTTVDQHLDIFLTDPPVPARAAFG
ncbi:eugenol synthase 1-like [Eucalyptus grandis]|uniref:eugenol synthase 1-like n=1 Tax=Eucalyptus grandis TaxID=71139 RepID=UPI00192ECBA8|nr:eugenol synthase 1-like [Eucalyptus grandis]